MKTGSILALVCLLGLGCAPKAKWKSFEGRRDDTTRRGLPAGSVVGFADGSATTAWLGLPYAEPPVGPLRWKAPRPLGRWSGVRVATRYGSECPQLGNDLVGEGRDGMVVGSEDCLTLNVFAPRAASATSARRPVVFWVHGGGNTIGTANTYGLVRNVVAAHDVVVVTVNSRLGVLGFFADQALRASATTPEDRSGNFATLDLIAALHWVHSNVSAFGGDPDNVTLMGESAGGWNIFALLASPLTEGLFSHAIIQSGLPASFPPEQAQNAVDDSPAGFPGSTHEVALRLLQKDGRAKDRAAAKTVLAGMSGPALEAYFRSKTPEELILPFQGAPFGMYFVPALVQDGYVLPTGSITRAVAERQKRHPFPVLLGSNRDEFKLFMALDPRYVNKRFGLLPEPRNQARFDRDAALVTQAWRAQGVDLPAHALAEAGGAGVFAYRFDWDEEPTILGVNLATLLGAAHGFEIPFEFLDEKGELDYLHAFTKENKAGRMALSRAMASYFMQFARTGAPGMGMDGSLPAWTPYDASAKPGFMVLDSPAGGFVRMDSGANDLDATVNRVWDTADFTPAERCKSYANILYGFLGTAGAWTPAREQTFQKHCPNQVAATLAHPR